MYNSFAEAVNKLQGLLQYVESEDYLESTALSGFRYWIMKYCICEDNYKCYECGLINEFKIYNINNTFSMALYIMKGVWRFNHNKSWTIESILNEQIMQDVIV